MAFCINCGHELVDGAKFCFKCGAKMNEVTSPYVEQRKIVYDGEIHRCPNCGDILDAYESICESCGYERRGTKATGSVQELSQKLQDIEARRPASNIFSIYQKQMEAGARIISNTDQKKIDLIKNFPIPNTREDMYEFLVLALSNVEARSFGLAGGSYTHKAISNAWYAKFEQAYTKAKLAFGKRPDFAEIDAIYRKKQQEISEAKKKKIQAILGIIFGSAAFVIILVGMILMLTLPVAKEKREMVSQESARLDAIVQEVYDAIEDEDYVLARAKAANVVYGGPTEQGGYQAKIKWEQVQKELLLVIDEAEQGTELEPAATEETEESP